ncbi:unnamed protein product [Aphanomyces euteiches]
MPKSTMPLAKESAPLRALYIKKWSYSQRSALHSYIEFSVLVRDTSAVSKAPHVVEIHRRFSQFHALHKALRDDGFALPDMPTFDLWTNVLIKLMPESALRERQMQLQAILDCVSRSKDMQATTAYKTFVGPTSELKYTSFSDIRIHPGVVPRPSLTSVQA